MEVHEENEIKVMVGVTAASRNEDGEAEGAMQLMMPGVLTQKGDHWLLCYQETLEDESDHTAVTHEVRLLMSPGHVTLLRKGPYGMMMVLDRGKRYEGVYHTPYGDMTMAIYPTAVRCQADALHGRVELVYQLDLQGGFVSERQMVVEYAALEQRA